ncbi:type VI secretion system baseplate subunit TssF, partial [Salmonella enterica subsp. enterica serovar Kinondoni]|nr:type VI secretion system baseplate subunit TssF [Salmonella enterica subsp. enterica serovar Kinondoni]ELP2195232.1 type VI secretion system baseplate subunit TssF [Salmonella enterica subsp. enterica serovar Champaign]
MNRLLSYYQKELNFLKQHGKIFASRYPKIARRLGIVEGETEDPHISRLIESFALLTSRIHQRLDDDMPELVNDLLAILAPQFIKPLPSICIVMVEPDPIHSGLTGKNTLATDTALFFRHSTPVPYQFQTVYPVTLLPIYLKDALLHYDRDALNWYLKLSFQVWSGATINNDTIRIYLNGPDNAVNTIYTFLCSEIKSLILNQEGKSSLLSPTDIKPV